MKKQCTIRILDEVNAVIVGLHPDHVSYFYESYAYHPPNHFFNPKFKLGTWDGKIRYFHKTGKTYVNLLDDMLPRIVKLGYSPKLIDLRTSSPVFPDLIDENFFSNVITEDGTPWIMRDYQVEMVNTLITAGGGVGLSSTGSGKTSMTAALALSYEKAADISSVIIVPDKNLTDQTRREYEFFGLDVGEYSGDHKDIQHKHVVSTWQAMNHNPKLIQNFGMVIVDECHGLKGQVIQKLLNEYGNNIPLRFGVTGTLPKAETDAMSVKISVGSVKYNIDAHTLMEAGHLAKLHIDIMQLKVDLQPQYQEYLEMCKEDEDDSIVDILTYKKFKNTYFPDFTAEKNFLQSETSRLQWITDYIDIKRQHGNVFCLVNGVRFGKKLAKLIPDAVFLYGQDKMEARKEIYQKFKDNNNLVVIATVNIASTGLDIKRIFNLIYIDMGKSFVRTIQTIGRGLRKAKDKDTVHVTDICSDLKYSSKHTNERIKMYKEAKYKHKKTIVDII